MYSSMDSRPILASYKQLRVLPMGGCRRFTEFLSGVAISCVHVKEVCSKIGLSRIGERAAPKCSTEQLTRDARKVRGGGGIEVNTELKY